MWTGDLVLIIRAKGVEVALDIVPICHTCSRNKAQAVFLEEYQGAYFGST